MNQRRKLLFWEFSKTRNYLNNRWLIIVDAPDAIACLTSYDGPSIKLVCLSNVTSILFLIPANPEIKTYLEEKNQISVQLTHINLFFKFKIKHFCMDLFHKTNHSIRSNQRWVVEKKKSWKFEHFSAQNNCFQCSKFSFSVNSMGIFW